MTNAPFDFSSTYTPGGYDSYSFGSSYVPPRLQTPHNEIRVNKTKDPDVYECEVIIRDLSEGFGQPWGDFNAFSHNVTSNTLNTMHPGEAILNHLVASETVIAGQTVMSWVDAAGATVVAGGQQNNDCLYYTAADGHTFTATTYSPAATISNLGYIVLGGVGTSARVVVFKVSAVPDVLSNHTTGASAGSMHSSLTSCFGVLTSSINAASPGTPYHLFYANNGIRGLSASAAIGDATTPLLTNVNNGGFTVAIKRLPGLPDRAYMVWPRRNIVDTMTQNEGVLMHLNLEGGDPHPVSLPMPYIHQAIGWNDSIATSDGLRIVQFTGEKGSQDLGWVTDREPNSDVSYRTAALGTLHGDLFAISVRRDDTTGANTRYALERFDGTRRHWHQMTIAQSPNSSTSVADSPGNMGTQYASYFTGNGFPVSRTASRAMMIPLGISGSEVNKSVFQAPAGYSSFNLYRNTSGAGASTGQEFATTGTARSVAMSLPYPLMGGVGVLEEIQSLGDLPAGGSTCTVEYELAEQTPNGFSFSDNLSASFLGSTPLRKARKPFGGNTSIFNRMQWQITITQGSSTRQTPNALPFRARFLCFLNGKDPVSPAKFHGEKWRP